MSTRISGALVVTYLATCIASGLHGETHYASQYSTNPLPPYLSWDTAALSIQDAIDEAVDGDTVVVSTGTYSLVSALSVTNGITLLGDQGACNTIISGGYTTRCIVLMHSNAVINGLTIADGLIKDYPPPGEHRHASSYGGGLLVVAAATIRSCTVTRCQSLARGPDVVDGSGSGDRIGWGGMAYGGGVAVLSDCRIEHCTITSNSAEGIPGTIPTSTSPPYWQSGPSGGYGSGIYVTSNVTCVISNAYISMNNLATYGGGVYGGIVRNSHVTRNSAQRGGGINSTIASQCIFIGNIGFFGCASSDSTITHSLIISNSGQYGGGAWRGTVSDSLLAWNYVHDGGGAGTIYSTVTCSTIVFNYSEDFGGGISQSQARNCIIVSNTSGYGPNWAYSSLEYSCTLPLPDGPGNMDVDPLFTDSFAADFRLLPQSPCINAGNSEFVTSISDIDGNARIQRCAVDLGAHESSYWGMHTDIDNDGFTDWIEAILVGSDPTNASRHLAIESLATDPGADSITIAWQSESGESYTLSRSTNLVSDSFTIAVASNIPAQPPLNTYTDSAPPEVGLRWYRVTLDP